MRLCRLGRLCSIVILFSALGHTSAHAVDPAKREAVSKSAKPEPVVKSPANIDPLDWPNWRGPEQNGMSRETGLVDSFKPEGGPGSNVLWKNNELGGISAPIVMRGKLYTMVRDQPDTPREGEKVVCVDPATGDKIWENRFNVFLSSHPAERIGWASCVGDPTTGRVYALGACGYFQCIDGDTGKAIWTRSLAEEFGLLSTYGGRTASPTLFEDLVIVNSVLTSWGEVARPAQRFMAFNKATGELVWFASTNPFPEDTTYSTPMFTVLKGQAAMVFGAADGALWAWQPRTGKTIWSYPISRRGLNVSPVVVDGKVYTGHEEENMDNKTRGGIIALDGAGSGKLTDKALLWPRAEGMVGKSAPLVVDGRIYAFDVGAKMYVLDAATGKDVCRPVKMTGSIMRASPLYADGKIYVCTTSGFHVFKPVENGVKVITKMRLPEEDEVSGSMIASHGRIYLPTRSNLYCLGQEGQKPSVTAQPPAPKETPAGKDDKPALVQVVPAEVLLKPGDKQKFTARLFNARGQLLRTSPATFKLAGPGAIDSDGQFAADNSPRHMATIVTAKVGDLEGQARIRVVPPLPWKFDFSDGEVPITWIGARYRHQIRDLDGNKVMVKITTIPKGARSRLWMGQTEYHDYTVQADMRGALAFGKKLPDMGLIAQRYILDVMGASQQLQIRSWDPQLGRFSKSVPFPWQADKWYTLKFQASAKDGKAVLKGKVWPRDEKEPPEWSIEAVDETPNVVGSPGLYGNANDAEIFIDNVSIAAND